MSILLYVKVTQLIVVFILSDLRICDCINLTMKVKQKRKHLELEEGDGSGEGVGGIDMDKKEPPDGLGFVSVLHLLRGYLGMLSSKSCDELRELIDQGI